MSEIIKNGNQVVVKPGQDIVASMANEFRAELHALVQDLPPELIVDLTKVEMVDSVGIGVLIATHNSLNKSGGALKVTNVNKDIHKLFNTMRLDRHFSVEKRAGESS